MDASISYIDRLLDTEKLSENQIKEILDFQDKSGVFPLINAESAPNDAKKDYILIPSHKLSAVLMREYVDGNLKIEKNLIKALFSASQLGFFGHGYDAITVQNMLMKTYINCKLSAFLNTHYSLVPEFTAKVFDILARMHQKLVLRDTKGFWETDYKNDYEQITRSISMNDKYYVAYGSNMNATQMHQRCADSQLVGTAYLEDWQLTMPFFANIEPKIGAKTPVVIWKISPSDESSLDGYEGFPLCYEKKYVFVDVAGKKEAALVYLMTNQYKKSNKKARFGYEDEIIKAYVDQGFSEDEYKPIRTRVNS